MATVGSSGLRVFTVAEAAKLMATDNKTVTKLVHRLAKKRKIFRIEKGKYFLIPPEAWKTGKYTEEGVIIASQLVKPYYLSYLTALSFYGWTEKPSKTIYVATTKLKRPLSFQGITIKFVRLRSDRFFGFTEQWIGNQKVAVADKEKTIVDCLDQPRYAGEIVEVAKGLWNGRNEIDFIKLIEYAKSINRGAIVKRFAYLMDILGILQPEMRKVLMKHINQTLIVLDPSQNETSMSVNKEWKIRVNVKPADLRKRTDVSLMKHYTPMIAQHHTPPYKIHRYFARRPWNVFQQLVEVFSEPQEIVLDPFCGGGVTIYEGLRKDRKAVGFDLNPLSIFLVRNMIQRLDDLSELTRGYSQVLAYIRFLYGKYNSVMLNSSQSLTPIAIPVEWNELAFKVICHRCGSIIVLSNDNKARNGRYHCPNSRCQGSLTRRGYIEPKDCVRIGYEYLYSVTSVNGKTIKFDFDAKRNQQVRQHLVFLKKQLCENDISIPQDLIPLNWDRQLEDLLERKGIRTFQDLFTERNLLINCLVLDFIKKLKMQKEVYELLRVVFSSSLRDTNIMSFTNEGWQSGRPTTWSKHAYWIPSQFCEVDVLSAFQRAFSRVKSAVSFNNQSTYHVKSAKKFFDFTQGANVLLQIGSIADSDIPDDSIDAIITDPPYGSNVQYLELSHFWYVWNRDLYGNVKPEFNKEAVSNRKKNFIGTKSMQDYENNLYTVFAKCYRVLKPGRYLVMTFNNKDIGAWLALLLSVFRAGFVHEKGGLYYQDGVENYKQTAHTKQKGSPYGDFIYVFKKVPTITTKSKTYNTENQFIEELDRTFRMHLDAFLKSHNNRNKVLLDMFETALPQIEGFVRSVLQKQGFSHNLFQSFNKRYLNRIYA